MSPISPLESSFPGIKHSSLSEQSDSRLRSIALGDGRSNRPDIPNGMTVIFQLCMISNITMVHANRGIEKQ